MHTIHVGILPKTATRTVMYLYANMHMGMPTYQHMQVRETYLARSEYVSCGGWYGISLCLLK